MVFCPQEEGKAGQASSTRQGATLLHFMAGCVFLICIAYCRGPELFVRIEFRYASCWLISLVRCSFIHIDGIILDPLLRTMPFRSQRAGSFNSSTQQSMLFALLFLGTVPCEFHASSNYAFLRVPLQGPPKKGEGKRSKRK